jgi:hypothetical protein
VDHFVKENRGHPLLLEGLLAEEDPIPCATTIGHPATARGAPIDEVHHGSRFAEDRPEIVQQVPGDGAWRVGEAPPDEGERLIDLLAEASRKSLNAEHVPLPVRSSDEPDTRRAQGYWSATSSCKAAIGREDCSQIPPFPGTVNPDPDNKIEN